MADAQGLGPCGRKSLGVQVSPSAQGGNSKIKMQKIKLQKKNKKIRPRLRDKKWETVIDFASYNREEGVSIQKILDLLRKVDMRT